MFDVTIGVPVYNEINFIKKTLESIDGQAGNIIISDNASTDGTSDVCTDFAAERKYVQYYRFDKNKGAQKNFHKCLELAKTKYFMWVGGHDLIEEGHISNLRDLLESSDAVLAYGNAWHADQNYNIFAEYLYNFAGYLASENIITRLYAVATFLTNCTIYHGLYKYDAIKQSYLRSLHKKYIALDHVILMEIARLGRMILCPLTRYIRISPREGDADQITAWTRVMKACTGTSYDPLRHLPLLFPKSVYAGQMSILKSVRPSSPVEEDFLKHAKQAVEERWGSWFKAPVAPDKKKKKRQARYK